MSRLINSYLSDYVKHSPQLSNWSLRDIEFKEDVIQNLFQIPPYFEVQKAACSCVTVKIPWSSLYSGVDPIVVEFERIEITLEEPVVMLALKKSAHTPTPAPTTAS